MKRGQGGVREQRPWLAQTGPSMRSVAEAKHCYPGENLFNIQEMESHKNSSKRIA